MIDKLNIMALVSASLMVLQIQAANTQFKTDFSGGIPPEVILIDGDGNIPSTAMANIGFEVGVPWIGYYVDDDDEYVACSTSWYKPAGTSDDWMILPEVTVGEGSTLRWRARSSDKKYFDGYVVYLSTDGVEREAFTTTLFTTEAEGNQWSQYEIDLSEYAGRDVNIAFVNNSTNKARLYVDDIRVGVDYPLIISIDTPALVENSDDGSDIVVTGTLSTELDDPSVLGDITLTYGGESIVVPCESIADSPLRFTFTAKPHISAGEFIDIAVDCKSANGYTCSASQCIWSVDRQVLVEEFTGTWCAWCVRGIVYMEALKERCGDKVIPLCVHQNDVMEVPEYVVDYLKGESIPNAIVNRKYELDPSGLLYLFDMGVYNTIPAAITKIDASFNPESGIVSTDVDVVFADNISDGAFSLAYLLVEDNVYQPDDYHYCQKNAYSGGAAGAMGGFENMPSVISPADITFHDVLRYVSAGGVHGVPRSLPGIVTAGREYAHAYTIDMPDNVLNTAETSLVVMVLDNRTGEVLNARSVKLAECTVPGSAPAVMGNISGPVSVYTIDGVCLGIYPSKYDFERGNHRSGMYILKSNDSTVKSYKF